MISTLCKLRGINSGANSSGKCCAIIVSIVLIHVRLVITLLPIPPFTTDYKYGMGKASLAPGQDFHLKYTGGAWHPQQREQEMLGVLDIRPVIHHILSVTHLLPYYQ